MPTDLFYKKLTVIIAVNKTIIKEKIYIYVLIVYKKQMKIQDDKLNTRLPL
jgi:hypothetical protein